MKNHPTLKQRPRYWLKVWFKKEKMQTGHPYRQNPSLCIRAPVFTREGGRSVQQLMRAQGLGRRLPSEG